MKAPENYAYENVYGAFMSHLQARSRWEAEWREIIKYITPARGRFDNSLTVKRVTAATNLILNPAACTALSIFASGLHGYLTNPATPWFQLAWSDPRLRTNRALVSWLQECNRLLHEYFHYSNFYQLINGFYTECGAFGMGAMYLGSDSDNDDTPFRFELMTIGEYACSFTTKGTVGPFFRTILMTYRKYAERFPETGNKMVLKQVEENRQGIDNSYMLVLEHVCRYRNGGKDFMRILYDITSSVQGPNAQGNAGTGWQGPLSIEGFYEHPYFVTRLRQISSQDDYGIGPGSEALPLVKRLQDMERSVSMGVHKSVDPPVMAPGRLRGQLNTLPGAKNFYVNPGDKVHTLYEGRFDLPAGEAKIEKIETGIGRIFFNEVFITASRDPNATPYKAAEVTARQREQMQRMGPEVNSFLHQFFMPILERAFNIAHRANKFPELPPELKMELAKAGGYNIVMNSPLVLAQKAIVVQSINSYLAFLANTANFKPEVLDNLNVDETAKIYAEVTGVPMTISNMPDEIKKIRSERKKAQMAAQKEAQDVQKRGAEAEIKKTEAEARLAQAEAGNTYTEAQQIAAEAGLF